MRIHQLLMIGLLGGCFGACVPSAPAAQEHWAETAMAAKGAREAWHYEEAIRLYFEALKEAETFGEDDPRLTATLRDLADCLTQTTKKYALAEELLKREQRIMRRLGPDFPGLVAGMDLLGRAYYNQGNYKEAEKTYLNAIKIAPEVGGGAHNFDWRKEVVARLGLCYQSEGKYDQAEQCFRSGLAAAQAKNDVIDLYWACRALAMLYYATHRYNDAILYFNHCIALNTKSPNWEDLLCLSEIYTAQKKDQEALKYVRQAAVSARRDLNDGGNYGGNDAPHNLMHTLYPYLAQHELAAGNYSASRAAAKEALTIAQSRKETALVKEIGNFLATDNHSH